MPDPTPAELAQIREAAERYRDAAEMVGGCSDGNCVIWRPTGMHTNGGCKCTWQMNDARQRNVTKLLIASQAMVHTALAILDRSKS